MLLQVLRSIIAYIYISHKRYRLHPWKTVVVLLIDWISARTFWHHMH